MILSVVFVRLCVLRTTTWVMGVVAGANSAVLFGPRVVEGGMRTLAHIYEMWRYP